MRPIAFFAALVSGLVLAGCSLTGPSPEPTWMDARIAEDTRRPTPAYVPELQYPRAQSWMMAAHARALADTRDLMISAEALLEVPRPEALEYGQRARERATPPPAPLRD